MFICYYSACYLFGNGKETILALPPSSKAMFNLRKTIAIKLHTQKVFPKTLPKKLPSNVSSTEQSAESVLKALEDLKENLPREVKETLIFSAVHCIKKVSQKISFEKEIKRGSARLLMDFKSNIQIGNFFFLNFKKKMFNLTFGLKGMSCEQEAQQYYNQSHRQLLGVLVQTGTKEIYFDVLSEDLSKDAAFVLKSLETIFAHEIFRNLNISELLVFSDGARHFRNK